MTNGAGVVAGSASHSRFTSTLGYTGRERSPPPVVPLFIQSGSKSVGSGVPFEVRRTLLRREEGGTFASAAWGLCFFRYFFSASLFWDDRAET